MTQQPHRVVVLVLDGALPLDVGIPAEVFHPETGFPCEVSACGAIAGTVPSHGGFGYAIPRSLDALDDPDTIIVPGYAPAGRTIPVQVREALRSAASRGHASPRSAAVRSPSVRRLLTGGADPDERLRLSGDPDDDYTPRDSRT
jgi:transcriptional regulator GlxA family with amidase domain